MLMMGAHVGLAQAEEGPPVCTKFTHASELDDGSVIAAGDGCLVKLDAQGRLDPGFAAGAPVRLLLGDDQRVIDLVVSDDGILVVSAETLARYEFDGSPDTSFGGDGTISVDETVPLTSHIFDVAIGDEGDIYFLGFQGPGGVPGSMVAKLDSSGQPDPSFGDQGAYHQDLTMKYSPQRLELDGMGRVLVGGQVTDWPAEPSVAVVRITTDGTTDTTFGENGISQSGSLIPGPCPNHCPVTLNGIDVAEDGTVTVLGSLLVLHLKSGSSGTLAAEFASDGTPGAVTSMKSDTPPAFDRLPGGDLAVAAGMGGRVRPDGTGGFSDGHAFTERALSPSIVLEPSISFNAATGHLLTAGYLGAGSDEDCGPSCITVRGVVVKIDAESGKPIDSFGKGGVSMPSPNRCPFGEASPTGTYGPWAPCRLIPPKIATKVKFIGVASRRPAIRSEIQMLNAPTVTLFAEQRVSLRLPSRLRLNTKRLRSGLRVKVVSGNPGSVTTSVTGRRITVTHVPDIVPWDNEYEGPPDNSPIRVSLNVGRGGIKPIPTRKRGRKLNFIAGAEFSTNRQKPDPWWGSSRTSQVKKLRLVGGR